MPLPGITESRAPAQASDEVHGCVRREVKRTMRLTLHEQMLGYTSALRLTLFKCVDSMLSGAISTSYRTQRAWKVASVVVGGEDGSVPSYCLSTSC
jgi:hypothetical protein